MLFDIQCQKCGNDIPNTHLERFDHQCPRCGEPVNLDGEQDWKELGWGDMTLVSHGFRDNNSTLIISTPAANIITHIPPGSILTYHQETGELTINGKPVLQAQTHSV